MDPDDAIDPDAIDPGAIDPGAIDFDGTDHGFRAVFAAFLKTRMAERGWSGSEFSRQTYLRTPAGQKQEGSSATTINTILRQDVLASQSQILLLLDTLQVDQKIRQNWHHARLRVEPQARDRAQPDRAKPGESVNDEARTGTGSAPRTTSSEPHGNSEHPDAGDDTQNDNTEDVDPARPPSVFRFVRARRRRLWVTLGAIGGALVVVLGVGWWWLGQETDIDGRVRCLSGQPVSGVWAKRPHSKEAWPGGVRPADGGWYTFNGHAPAHRSFELHVGCGYLPNGVDWKVIAYTPADVPTTSLTVECDDSAAAIAVPPYRGTCTVH